MLLGDLLRRDFVLYIPSCACILCVLCAPVLEPPRGRATPYQIFGPTGKEGNVSEQASYRYATISTNIDDLFCLLPYHRTPHLPGCPAPAVTPIIPPPSNQVAVKMPSLTSAQKAQVVSQFVAATGANDKTALRVSLASFSRSLTLWLSPFHSTDPDLSQRSMDRALPCLPSMHLNHPLTSHPRRPVSSLVCRACKTSSVCV